MTTGDKYLCRQDNYGKMKDKWEDLAKANKDQRDVLYQHAALLPEDEFDLAEMATALKDPVNKKVSKLTAQDRENFWSQHKISPKPQEPKDLKLPHM